MDAIKSLIYFSIIFIISFIIFVVSINHIINLAKPSREIIRSYLKDDQLYKSAYMTVSGANLNYMEATKIMSARYPNIPGVASKVGINPQISKLPDNEQENAIRLSILESRLNHLDEKIELLASESNDSLLFQIGFYIASFFAWMASVVISNILSYFTIEFMRKE